MNTVQFTPAGNLASFTADSTAPTSVQSTGRTQVAFQQYLLTNTDTTAGNNAVVGWGQTDAQAKLAAAAGTGESNCIYLMANSQVVVTAAPNAFFTGIRVANTPVIKVQVGCVE